MGVRRLVRHGIGRLNDGDPSFLLRLAHRDAQIPFPGDNRCARMHRPVVKVRERHATHRGIDECHSFADRFVEAGLHNDIEDILVNGGPWHARVAVRGTDHLAGPDGDEYNNRLARVPRDQVGPTGVMGGLRRHRTRRGLGPPTSTGMEKASRALSTARCRWCRRALTSTRRRTGVDDNEPCCAARRARDRRSRLHDRQGRSPRHIRRRRALVPAFLFLTGLGIWALAHTVSATSRFARTVIVGRALAGLAIASGLGARSPTS